LPQDIRALVSICSAAGVLLFVAHDEGWLRSAWESLKARIARNHWNPYVPPPSRWWGSR
jgi:predicted dehydrogenase